MSKENRAAEALSQVELKAQSQLILLVPSFDLVKQLKLENDNSSELQALHMELIDN